MHRRKILWKGTRSNLILPKSTVWYVNIPLLKKTRIRLSLEMMLYYVKVTVLHGYIESALGSINKLMKPLVNLTLLTFVPTVWWTRDWQLYLVIFISCASAHQPKKTSCWNIPPLLTSWLFVNLYCKSSRCKTLTNELTLITKQSLASSENQSQNSELVMVVTLLPTTIMTKIPLLEQNAI